MTFEATRNKNLTPHREFLCAEAVEARTRNQGGGDGWRGSEITCRARPQKQRNHNHEQRMAMSHNATPKMSRIW